METGVNYRISGGQKLGQWEPEIKTGVNYRISGGQKFSQWEPEVETGVYLVWNVLNSGTWYQLQGTRYTVPTKYTVPST